MLRLASAAAFALFAAGIAIPAAGTSPAGTNPARPAVSGAAGVGPRGAPGALAASDPATRRRHAELMRWAAAQRLRARPLGEIAVALGRQLVGVPYVAGVLDATPDERLLAPLDRFDCVLYVESVLAMARGIAEGDTTFAGYLARVEAQRYRDGQRAGYGSRLHYFSEWADDNAARGLVRDVTADLPGHAPFRQALSFMTTHRTRYPHLARADAFEAVRAAEARVNAAPRAYLPKARVRAAYDGLRTGDVVATTARTPGLDVTHVGFAVRHPDGTVGFLHASPQGGVKLSPDLHAYLAGNRAQTGVFVVRAAAENS